jgi:hypothetical protein
MCNLLIRSKYVQLLVIDPDFLYNKFAAIYPIANFLKGGETDGNFTIIHVRYRREQLNKVHLCFEENT